MPSTCTLPALQYRLWLPGIGAYVRQVDWACRRIATTTDPDRARVLPEPMALAEGRKLVRRTPHVIELRPVGPGLGTGSGGAQ